MPDLAEIAFCPQAETAASETKIIGSLLSTGWNLPYTTHVAPFRRRRQGGSFRYVQSSVAHLRLVPKQLQIRSTTILCVRRDSKVVMAGDGQVTLGSEILKA